MRWVVGSTADSQPSGGTGALADEAAAAAAACSATLPGRAVGGGVIPVLRGLVPGATSGRSSPTSHQRRGLFAGARVDVGAVGEVGVQEFQGYGG